MDYQIVYSGRKTISLCVKNEKLVVRAPYGVSKEKIDKLVRSHSEWVKKHINRQTENRAKYDMISDNDIAELRKRAKAVIPIKVANYARIMGLKYGRITITGAKTRFGSCSSKGNIAFSYRLMMYPDEAVDYVVVHELAHLKEMNHSSRFYAIIASVLPDYKERRKLLKR